MAIFVDQEQLMRGIAKSLRGRVLPELASGREKFIAQCAFELTAYLMHRKNRENTSPDVGSALEMAERIRNLTAGSMGDNETKEILGILQMDSAFYKEDYVAYKAFMDEFSEAGQEDFEAPTVDQLSRVMQVLFDDPNAEARIVGGAVGGYSKQTILFDCVSRDRGVQELVMRRDLPFAATDRSSVVEEYPILKAVFEAGLPVPEPIFIEPDTSVLGTPFLISRRMPGRTMGDVLGLHEVPDFDPERELGALLAKLHTIKLDQLGLSGFSDVRFDSSFQQQRIKSWMDIYRANVEVPSAAMEIGLAWLYNNAHLIAGGGVIVHGDVGYHNILFHEGKLTALLDWELVHVGSAAEDLAYVASFIEFPKKLIDEYVSAGGERPSEGALTYCQIFGNVRNAIYGTVGMRQFNEGAHDDISMLPIILSTYSAYVTALEKKLTDAIAAHGFRWNLR